MSSIKVHSRIDPLKQQIATLGITSVNVATSHDRRMISYHPFLFKRKKNVVRHQLLLILYKGPDLIARMFYRCHHLITIAFAVCMRWKRVCGEFSV